jgi:hypothetical protein
VGGLHDHRNIASGILHARQYAHAVEIGHHQVEDHAVDPHPAADVLHRRVAALCGDRVVAETLHHVFDEATLDWIVVDDQHNLRHELETPTDCTDLVQCRCFGLTAC